MKTLFKLVGYFFLFMLIFGGLINMGLNELGSLLLVIILFAAFFFYRNKKRREKLNYENRHSLIERDLHILHKNHSYQDIINKYGKYDPDYTSSIVESVALAYERLNKHSEALYFFDKLIDRESYSSKHKLNKAIIQFKMNDYVNCIETLEGIDLNSFKYGSEYSDQYYTTIQISASCYYEMEKYDYAITQLKRAPLGKKNKEPKLIDLIFLLAECYEKKGDLKNALKYYKEVKAFKFSYEGVDDRIDNIEMRSQ